MITFNEALKIVTESCAVLEYERIKINDSLNRVLAEDIFSDINMPPFNKSAMDGYACRSSDLKNSLEIIEVIPAGKVPSKSVNINQCSKIMTGAIVPEGANCVIKVENTFISGDHKVNFTKEFTDKNICFLGEDIREGDKLIGKFTKISPVHIAVLSSAGVTLPLVIKRPAVGIICTGSELVEPDMKPGISQIRNSNANQLIAQIKNAGAIPYYYGIVEDSKEATIKIINKAISKNDIVIVTGGVSVGDYDYVPEALSEIGFDILFSSIAMQPGKPSKFALLGKKLCFGLPGNPVSCFLQFELLIKPVLKKMSGELFKPSIKKFKINSDYSRKNVEREAFIPVKMLDENTVTTASYHGSAHINSFLDIDGIISLPIGQNKINKGEIVDVRQI
jgi:molybdopterin molybdotransferase